MLASLGRYYRWPRAELEALDAAAARFWLGAANALEERAREER